MIRLEGVAAFVAVVEAGSLSAAARRLGRSKSVIGERLAELERTLGARLLQRSSRRSALTEDGAGFLERARRMLGEAAEAAAEIAQRRGALVGPLRISGPVSFGILHLGPALYPFLAANPGIALTLELDDRFVDPAAEGYDATVRHGHVADSRLIARRLASSRRLLVASPAHLRARAVPRTPAELEEAAAIIYANRDADWRFAGPGGTTVLRPRSALRVNNGLVMRDAAVAGLGIALLPTFLVHRELEAGALVAVDVGLVGEEAQIHLAYPTDRRGSAKLDALARSLRATFGDPPYWDVGLADHPRLHAPRGEG